MLKIPRRIRRGPLFAIATFSVLWVSSSYARYGNDLVKIDPEQEYVRIEKQQIGDYTLTRKYYVQNEELKFSMSLSSIYNKIDLATALQVGNVVLLIEMPRNKKYPGEMFLVNAENMSIVKLDPPLLTDVQKESLLRVIYDQVLRK